MRRAFRITGEITSPVLKWKKGGCYAPVAPEWGDGAKVNMTPIVSGKRLKTVLQGTVTVTTRNRAYVNIDCDFIDEHKITEMAIIPASK